MDMADAVQRRLAAILAADVAGYSRLMAEDEEGTLRTLAAYRSAIADLIGEHSGRIFGTAGDSVVAEFASAVQAVRAAVAMQRALDRRNADLPESRRMAFRIGLNLGDVMADGDDLLGDGVNVAARLQEIAAPGGICITGALREQIQGKVTFPLASLGERALKNIPRPVQAYRVDWTLDEPGAAGDSGGALSLPDKPSIAVLPLVNMSGDAEQEYFADGMTEDIITALSRYRWFFVIARNSSFAYKGRAVDVKQIARELGVRYVLEGSVRKAGNRVRITAQLIEAESGNHLWAERYDRDYADVFGVQDEITESVVGAIEPEILMGEGRRALRKNATSLDAYDRCMRGMHHHYQFAAADNREAEKWLRQAVELDPNLAFGHMALARTLVTRIVFGWSEDILRDAAAVTHAGARAVALDDRDPYCHYAHFFGQMLSGRLESALAEAQRSIDLSPNFALGHFALGWTRICLGHLQEASAPLLRAVRLSPNDPVTFLFLSVLSLAHYHRRDYEEAVKCAKRSMRGRRIFLTLRTLVASLGQLGRLDEARATFEEAQQVALPDAANYWKVLTRYADPEQRVHLLEGIEKAGVTAKWVD
jgi:adenylate cyclase